MAKVLNMAASAWLFVWLGLIAVYIHFGALAFAGLVVLLGSVGAFVWIGTRVLPLQRLWPLIPIMLFLGWLGITSFWSEFDASVAIRLGAQVAIATAIPALFLTRSETVRTHIAHLLMAMALGGITILWLDVVSGYALSTFGTSVDDINILNKEQSDAEMNIGRGLVAYSILWPVLSGLFLTYLPKVRAWSAIVVFTILLILTAWGNRLFVPFLMLALALPVFALGWAWPTLIRRLMVGFASASILFAPVIGFASRLADEAFMAGLPMSWDHRLRMWDFALSRIEERPILGHGLDSSRTMQDSFTTRINVDVPFISLHPHNIGLQTWMETGAIGAILLSLAILTLDRPLSWISRGDRLRNAAISGILAAATVGSALTVGAWQYWWWGLLMLSPMLVLLFRAPSYLMLKQ